MNEKKNKRILTRSNQVNVGKEQKAFMMVVVVVIVVVVSLGNNTKDMCDIDENEKELFSSPLFFLLLLTTTTTTTRRERVRSGHERENVSSKQKKNDEIVDQIITHRSARAFEGRRETESERVGGKKKKLPD